MPVSVISLVQKALMGFCVGLFVLEAFAKCLSAFICQYSKSVKKKEKKRKKKTAHRMSDCVLGVILALFITINAIKPNGYSKEVKARISSTGSVKPVKWVQGRIADAYTCLTLFCLDLFTFDKS